MAMLPSEPLMIAVKKTMPANSLKELIAWLKANPNKASSATSGIGGPSHVAGILFEKETGTQLQLVPYQRRILGGVYQASRSVARETVHRIAWAKPPLLDYDHQLISLATGSCIVRSRRACSTSGTSGPALKPTRAEASNSVAA